MLLLGFLLRKLRNCVERRIFIFWAGITSLWKKGWKEGQGGDLGGKGIEKKKSYGGKVKKEGKG